QGDEQIDWISKDIRNPNFLTVTTYQALHAAFAGEQELREEETLDAENEAEGDRTARKSETADVIALLVNQKTHTIVLDEAHHLRNEWWKALTRLKAGLNKPTTVSLTATPPYDVDHKEWQKYEALCGPVDAEISVPELVKRGDLCPHQDYVHFSLPTQREEEKLRQFKGDISNFLRSLKSDQGFLAILASHPWVENTNDYIEDILKDPKLFSSLIIFLNTIGIRAPRYALDILGVGQSGIPPLTPDWLETFLTCILYTHADLLADHAEVLESIRKELKRIGAIERRKVVIDNTKEIKKLLAGSLSKLESIVDITRAETNHLKTKLRMVILTDYIRSTELPSNANDLRPINKIGAIPIFETLRRSRIEGTKIGVLTGSLILIPKDTKPLLERIATKMQIDPSHILYGAVVHDDLYLRVDIKGEQRQKIVRLITEVFTAGGITVLVGTQALLGEGWDAPSINSLILASYVGSYMLSNQMRGRAIRVDPLQPNKTANIWHLVAVDIETLEEKLDYQLTGQTRRQKDFDPFAEIKKDLGNDFRMVCRRFRAFEGLSYESPVVIENGFGRLGLSNVKWESNASVKQLSQSMIERAMARDKLPQAWMDALVGSSPKPELQEEVAVNHVPRGFAFADTLKYLVVNALIVGAAYGLQILRAGQNFQEPLILLMIGLGLAVLYATPKLAKALYLLLRNGSLENSMKQVGCVVLETLRHMDLVTTDPNSIRIQTVKHKYGAVHCRLDGATTTERRHFFDAMQEVLGPTHNPRYLLVRQSYLGRLLRVDYHQVPEVIGQNKKNAEFFVNCWKHYVGFAELVYTRSAEGRITLLQARTKSLASAFRKKTSRRTKWE
ncbi:MAG: DEAD/DEAH box helicase family protein, partial [Parvibaculaceae bacterium]|nr:DEAD/DEAH box helicase family protein [Parvibaculaceae bacterium]